MSQEWFKTPLADTVRLPGTLEQNKKGPQARATERVMELSSEYPYEGVAWYQRTVQIPEDWRGRHVELFLERTRVTRAWLDGTPLGEQDALGVAQIYPIRELSPGPHRLTIRVDSKTDPYGVSGHMVNTSTQTKWNGLLGDLHLAAHDPVWIQQVRGPGHPAKERDRNCFHWQHHPSSTAWPDPLVRFCFQRSRNKRPQDHRDNQRLEHSSGRFGCDYHAAFGSQCIAVG